MPIIFDGKYVIAFRLLESVPSATIYVKGGKIGELGKRNGKINFFIKELNGFWRNLLVELASP